MILAVGPCHFTKKVNFVQDDTGAFGHGAQWIIRDMNGQCGFL